MKRPALRDKQITAIKFGLANPYCIFALDPRLGKSRSAIETHERRKKSNCLVICPGYLVANWVEEVHRWTDNKIVTAIKKGKDIYDLIDTDYCIVSYDLAQKAPYFFEWANTVIIDEAHYLKNQAAKRTEFIHKHIFENSVPSVLQLTGTPIKNRVEEFYSLLALTFYNPNLRDPAFLERFPTSIDFADYFSHRHEYDLDIGYKMVKIVKWVGMKNIPELKSMIKGNYLRIKADDKDFPPIMYTDFLIDSTPNPQLLNDFKTYFLDESTHSVMSNFKKEAAIKKAPITALYAKDLLEKRETPILVYSDHVESCEIIAKELGVPALTGKMPSHKRMELAKRFQDGEGAALCATVGALSVGVDLSRSKDIVLNDPCWVPGDLKQVFYRAQAVGGKGSVLVHRIFGSPQDEKIWEALAEKIEVIEKVS